MPPYEAENTPDKNVQCQEENKKDYQELHLIFCIFSCRQSMADRNY
ncbi:rCG56974 [Rattus norvegicus]|uniref:RCG56974 n=1 Tax=Rattus norvegicus TaxID=10116 RepID=A6JCT3_RAT|nr:rCG56974 [Rattus norvegicus]